MSWNNSESLTRFSQQPSAIATHGEHGTRLTMRVKSTMLPLLKQRHVSVAAGQNRAF